MAGECLVDVLWAVLFHLKHGIWVLGKGWAILLEDATEDQMLRVELDERI